LVSATPSQIGKFAAHGRFTLGTPARLVVFNARTINEIVCRPHSDRVIIDRGERLRAAMPDYSELWQEQSELLELAAPM
jgi:cytosine deaminase